MAPLPSEATVAAPSTEKPCRVCPEARHMFEAFAKFGKESTSKQQNPSESHAVEHSHAAATVSEDNPSLSNTKLECPPDVEQLGRSTWTFLHTMGAYYPEAPSIKQQELMRIMLAGLGEFYPCQHCAEHQRQEMAQKPPPVGSNTELSMWLCGIHNEVNDRLGKPQFDCSRVFERWRHGPADGSCDGGL